MKNGLKPLIETLLRPFELKPAALATYTPVQKKFFGSGMTTLTISNEEMNDIIKNLVY